MLNKRICALFMTIVLAVMLAACGSGAKEEKPAETAETSATEETADAAETEEAADAAATEETASADAASEDSGEKLPLRHVEIEIENYGVVKLELDPNEAPLTVENFIKLAQEGFYDGLTFHRIMDGFMIQGGDPNGNGTGGSSENIVGEFAANNIQNNISHKEGVISMARARDFNSASSQFFIMVDDTPSLDGKYAAFGHVTEGQEVVDQIAKDARPTDDNGTIPKEEQPVITSIRILD